MAVPTVITKLIEGIVRGSEPHADDLPEWTARRHGGVPLMGDLGRLWFLRPDGSIHELAWDSDEAPTPLPEDKRVLALAAGLDRYPWLAALLPPIPPHADACSTCRGQGRVRTSADRTLAGLLCARCSGLGWSTSEDPASHGNLGSGALLG